LPWFKIFLFVECVCWVLSRYLCSGDLVSHPEQVIRFGQTIGSSKRTGRNAAIIEIRRWTTTCKRWRGSDSGIAGRSQLRILSPGLRSSVLMFD
jgi:hypothetical protein